MRLRVLVQSALSGVAFILEQPLSTSLREAPRFVKTDGPQLWTSRVQSLNVPSLLVVINIHMRHTQKAQGFHFTDYRADLIKPPVLVEEKGGIGRPGVRTSRR